LQNFLYSKIMLWVAVDRGLRLADKRSLPLKQRDKVRCRAGGSFLLTLS
jgi:hypothetical protein